jgi:hypothetical protein
MQVLFRALRSKGGSCAPAYGSEEECLSRDCLRHG